jgi:DNA (cytosine-5)-methyltransferase 1
MLCGATFCLGTYRHRFFEVHGFSLPEPEHPAHNRPTTKMGRPPEPGEMMHVVGNFSGVGEAREAMGIIWMTRDELREAVPPAYTKFIGDSFLQGLVNVAA